jgi:hypothetical protein
MIRSAGPGLQDSWTAGLLDCWTDWDMVSDSRQTLGPVYDGERSALGRERWYKSLIYALAGRKRKFFSRIVRAGHGGHVCRLALQRER